VTLILELLSGTMYLMWLACGCFLAAVVAWLTPEVAWAPWAMFAISTSVLVYLGRGWADHLHGEDVPSNVYSLVGQNGVVIETIDPIENTGRVRINSEEWRARADVRFEEKERVKVEGVEGASLRVVALDS
jgi:membrane protein implicated in regulation of membrane protease activity